MSTETILAEIAAERRRKSELEQAIRDLRDSIHACNRNPIPSSKRREWRDMCDAALDRAKAKEAGR